MAEGIWGTTITCMNLPRSWYGPSVCWLLSKVVLGIWERVFKAVIPLAKGTPCSKKTAPSPFLGRGILWKKLKPQWSYGCYFYAFYIAGLLGFVVFEILLVGG